MLVGAVKNTGLRYSKKVFKDVTYEYLRKTLADDTYFITIKKTMQNGDVYTKTKKNGKTILQTYKANLPVCGTEEAKGALYTEVKRFFPNNDVSITERFINYRKGEILSFMDQRNNPIVPTQRKFPTKEIITTTDLYSGLGLGSKRIFSSYCQESPVGQSSVCNFLTDSAKIKEIGVLKTRLREQQGRLIPDNLNIRYVK